MNFYYAVYNDFDDNLHTFLLDIDMYIQYRMNKRTATWNIFFFFF